MFRPLGQINDNGMCVCVCGGVCMCVCMSKNKSTLLGASLMEFDRQPLNVNEDF